MCDHPVVILSAGPSAADAYTDVHVQAGVIQFQFLLSELWQMVCGCPFCDVMRDPD